MIIGSGITIGNGIRLTSENNSLYTFTTFTFTTANTYGRFGPNVSTSTSWYQANYSGNTWVTNTSYYNQLTQGYQRWTVPATGNYSIQVAGSRAGRDTLGQTYISGNGAIVSGTVSLTQGQILEIICGQYLDTSVSSYASYAGFGGGGGSFVNNYSTSTLLFAAGGGGGAGTYSGASPPPTGYVGQNGVTATWAGNGAVSGSNVGGNNGFGGNVYTTYSIGYRGGAGGGWLTNGQNGDGTTTPTGGANYGWGGNCYTNGFTGGNYGITWGNPSSYAATYGGFGGGGGSNGIINGGGGGGYSGGGISGNVNIYEAQAGGGGSFVITSATNISTSDGNYNGIATFNGNPITNLSSYNIGSGTVVITKLF
jgi:hypothetical protein